MREVRLSKFVDKSVKSIQCENIFKGRWTRTKDLTCRTLTSQKERRKLMDQKKTTTENIMAENVPTGAKHIHLHTDSRGWAHTSTITLKSHPPTRIIVKTLSLGQRSNLESDQREQMLPKGQRNTADSRFLSRNLGRQHRTLPLLKGKE